MVNIFDVSKYILEKKSELPAMKLHKLLYYSQAWHITWEENVLFHEDIEAWENGPIIPILYPEHKDIFKLTPELLLKGDSSKLNKLEKENIDKVLLHYGDKTSQWLSDLTHMEDPWIKTKIKETILLADIHEYYSGL